MVVIYLAMWKSLGLRVSLNSSSTVRVLAEEAIRDSEGDNLNQDISLGYSTLMKGSSKSRVTHCVRKSCWVVYPQPRGYRGYLAT